MEDNQINWTGDLSDDCSAEWNGFLLRAEWMDDDCWWWCVYDQISGEQLAASNWGTSSWEESRTGDDARAAAEKAARSFAAMK